MTVLSRLWSGVCRSGLVSSSQPLARRGLVPNTVWKLSRRGFRKPNSLRSKRTKKLTPEMEFETPNLQNTHKSLLKCSIFAAGFCTATFVGTTIWQYERKRTNEKDPLLRWVRSHWNTMEGWQNKEGDFRQALNKWWNGLSDGTKVFWPICFLNGLVYVCWNIPPLQRTMFRYFAFSPAALAVCWPMLLSVFSHYNFFHLAANMYVMHSFSQRICDKMGQEQFVAMYLCCGVLSSLAGAMFKVLIKCSNPSLGASGAIMGMLGYFCSINPETRVSVIFIPQFNVSAERGLYGLMCLDTLGLIMRWRLFDHAAHLGGMICGLSYAKWGDSVMWQWRQIIMHYWHYLRTSFDDATKDR